MNRSIRVRFSRKPRRSTSASGDEPAEATASAPAIVGFEDFDPFREGEVMPDPVLTSAERARAEEEARHGIPTSAATGPSPGERRVESRFQEALARIRVLTDGALGRLRAGWFRTGCSPLSSPA